MAYQPARHPRRHAVFRKLSVTMSGAGLVCHGMALYSRGRRGWGAESKDGTKVLASRLLCLGRRNPFSRVEVSISLSDHPREHRGTMGLFARKPSSRAQALVPSGCLHLQEHGRDYTSASNHGGNAPLVKEDSAAWEMSGCEPS